jgi:hypothetical protein
MGNNFSYSEIDSDCGSVVEYNPLENKTRIYHRNKSFFYRFFRCFYKKKLGNISKKYVHDESNVELV